MSWSNFTHRGVLGAMDPWSQDPLTPPRRGSSTARRPPPWSRENRVFTRSATTRPQGGDDAGPHPVRPVARARGPLRTHRDRPSNARSKPPQSGQEAPRTRRRVASRRRVAPPPRQVRETSPRRAPHEPLLGRSGARARVGPSAGTRPRSTRARRRTSGRAGAGGVAGRGGSGGSREGRAADGRPATPPAEARPRTRPTTTPAHENARSRRRPPGADSGRASGSGLLRRSRRPRAARTTSRAGGTSARSPSTCARACRSRRG